MWSYAKAESRNAESINAMKRRPGKRMIFKLLLFLLAGAIINVAVAWSFAAWVPMRKWSQTIHGAFNQHDQTWQIVELRQWGATQVRWTARITYDRSGNVVQRSPEEKLVGAHRQVELDSKSDPGRVTRNAPPEFGSLHEPIPPEEFHGNDWAFGWPQRSLWNKVIWPKEFPRVPIRVEGGIRLDQGLHNIDSRALPLWPLWPGLAINTIFYAAVLWVLFAAPFKVRRWCRMKRGQCASCGYSQRGTSGGEKCPECGATA